jgi:hypothetical protein
MLETPNRAVVVETVGGGGDELMRMSVTGTRTRVRIWRNHPDWPDEVRIGVG